jgi:predicted phosphodiesterase
LDAKKSSFSFIVFCDLHDRVEDFKAALASVDWKDVDLVFLNGDMLDKVEGESHLFWGIIDPCVEAFATRIPFVFVRGNHETRGRFARQLPTYFPSQENCFYFAFTHGGARFVVLDSGEDRPDGSQEYGGLVDFDHYRSEQAEWLRREVLTDAFRSARFRIVLVHIPLADVTSHAAADMRRKWAPILYDADIDLMISGHLHRYGRLDPKGERDFPIIIGAADTVVRIDVTDNNLRASVRKHNGSKADPQSLLIYWHDVRQRVKRIERRMERRRDE